MTFSLTSKIKGFIALFIVAGSLLLGANKAEADTLFVNGDFSVSGSAVSGGFNFQTVALNNNSPVSFTGNIYYLTLYSPDVNATALQIANGSTPQYTEVATCSIPIDLSNDGSICDGTSTSELVEVGFGNIQTSVGGNFITFELKNPLSVTSGDYVYIRALSHSNIRFSGFDTSSCYTATANLFDCPNGYDSMYAVLSGSGGFSDPTNYDTRIVSFTPENGTTTASTSVEFTLHTYINPDDIGSVLGITLTLHNINQNILGTLLPDFLDSNDIYFLNEFQATTSGDYYFSTTTVLSAGNYRINAKMDRSYLGFNWPFNPFDISINESHQFIVVEPTFVGNISQNGYTAINGALASTSATTTLAMAQTCNPFGGSPSTLFYNTTFNPISCLSFLFIPDSGLIYDSLNNFKNNVNTHFPLGYVTDFLVITGTTTEGTLTLLDTTLPSALGFGTPRITLDLSHVLDGILYSTSTIFTNEDTVSDRNFFDITNDYWSYFIWISALFYVLARVLGSHLIPNPFATHEPFQQHSWGKGKVSDESYRLKETLYRMSQRK